MGDMLTRYAVFHAEDIQAMMVPQGRYYYLHVAEVEARSLGEVFLLTNHRECAWQQEDAVVWSAPGPQRSTSIGDVIYAYETGQAWLVLSGGFSEAPVLVKQCASCAVVFLDPDTGQGCCCPGCENKGGDAYVRNEDRWSGC